MTDSTPCRDWLTSGGEDLWHPESRGRAAPIAEALGKRICRACPIQLACLEQALTFEAANGNIMRWGIWGGLDPNERGKLAKGRAA